MLGLLDDSPRSPAVEDSRIQDLIPSPGTVATGATDNGLNVRELELAVSAPELCIGASRASVRLLQSLRSTPDSVNSCFSHSSECPPRG